MRPEVKQTLEKIVYQLDVVKSTLGLLEHRITQNEGNLVEMMNYIRNEDVVYVSYLHLPNLIQQPPMCKQTVKEMDRDAARFMYDPRVYKQEGSPSNAHRPLTSTLNQAPDIYELRKRLEEKMALHGINTYRTAADEK